MNRERPPPDRYRGILRQREPVAQLVGSAVLRDAPKERVGEEPDDEQDDDGDKEAAHLARLSALRPPSG